METKTILRGRLVTDTEVIADGAVVFTDEIVKSGVATEILSAEELAAAEQVEGYLFPGLVDVHCHGGGGESFPNAETTEQAMTAVMAHRVQGTTSLVASAVTAAPEVLKARAAVLTELCEAGELAGVHFEGPFVSHARCGAQDPTYIIDPDPELTQELLEICKGYCTTMTVAPEKGRAYGEGSVAEVLIEGGALPSWGHTDSGPDHVRAALEYSREKLSVVAPRSPKATVTHLFNGMRPIHHRDPGPVPEFLSDAARDGAILEVISDGVHLNLAIIRSVYETLGRNALVLVTDAMAAAGMPDGSYQLGPQGVTVKDGVARLTEGDSIAGGTSRLIDQIRLLVTGGYIPLVDAVYMATAQGAKILGDERVGTLSEGAHADVLVVSEDFQVERVYRRGKVVA
ncbi:putative N-acetylglucosamine-6-phosphate deacetylase [Gleimia coleocanis DSM 15436]|uniref:Putative N-acetylglucosamine-6-phosphate deacetylase n=1 Tax=Gleimia coleocanis DSM 15436 TaxID=525245 RepID=C0W009_9ACTO|nr:amidohydrolase family protein [Gleimia coleocanis]EEH63868.1 putative N-acetylglucosamine-6-phosphate deacetylase [Gleimia coleocanis DSM 15436]